MEDDDEIQDDGNDLDISLGENIGDDFNVSNSDSVSDSDLETNAVNVMEDIR